MVTPDHYSTLGLSPASEDVVVRAAYLALMRRFLDAVPEHARVIMLGDPDQLASVEAGGVHHDRCVAADGLLGDLLQGGAGAVRLRRALGERWSTMLGYRGYHDQWSIESHTVTVEAPAGFTFDPAQPGTLPVGVTVDPRGALIVADDLSNTVWRVTPTR